MRSETGKVDLVTPPLLPPAETCHMCSLRQRDRESKKELGGPTGESCHPAADVKPDRSSDGQSAPRRRAFAGSYLTDMNVAAALAPLRSRLGIVPARSFSGSDMGALARSHEALTYLRDAADIAGPTV